LELGVDTSKIHHNCIKTAIRHGYAGGCPVSEDLARRVLTLPNFAGLRSRDVERVATAFLTALARYRESIHGQTSHRRTKVEAYAG
jgi:dTDP-4-amino-4,6-dideoxygalactose transaminase